MVVTNEMIEAFIENVKNGYADIGVVVDGEFSIDGIVNVRESLTAALAVAPGVEVKPPEPIADDSFQAMIGEVGNEIHTLGCERQNDEELSSRLFDLACRLWGIAKRVPAALATTETNGHPFTDGDHK